jgi:hypothetical protein
MVEWKYNPKTMCSGIITCIPQDDTCPNECEDCFFQSGRSYLEPLSENLPHVPSVELTKGRIVRMNDGNDSNHRRDIVTYVAQQYEDYFYNTAIPKDLKGFNAPVVLTVNPGEMTDTGFHRLKLIPSNLMFVRVRVNMWNLDDVVAPVVNYYTNEAVPVVFTFMAYYTKRIPNLYSNCYEWKKRTLNSYYVLKQEYIDNIMNLYRTNAYVYSCGYKGKHACTFCGNCIREYYNTKERMR